MRTMDEGQVSLSSGALAKQVGVSTDTLRYYERQGLLPLPPRAENGYRRYARGAVDRVRLIRRALSLGISLEELGRLLRVRDRGGTPCATARALLAEKLKALDMRLAELGATVFAGSSAEFGRFIANETEKWGKVIRSAGIKPE